MTDPSINVIRQQLQQNLVSHNILAANLNQISPNLLKDEALLASQDFVEIVHLSAADPVSWQLVQNFLMATVPWTKEQISWIFQSLFSQSSLDLKIASYDLLFAIIKSKWIQKWSELNAERQVEIDLLIQEFYSHPHDFFDSSELNTAKKRTFLLISIRFWNAIFKLIMILWREMNWRSANVASLLKCFEEHFLGTIFELADSKNLVSQSAIIAVKSCKCLRRAMLCYHRLGFPFPLDKFRNWHEALNPAFNQAFGALKRTNNYSTHQIAPSLLFQTNAFSVELLKSLYLTYLTACYIDKRLPLIALECANLFTLFQSQDTDFLHLLSMCNHQAPEQASQLFLDFAVSIQFDDEICLEYLISEETSVLSAEKAIDVPDDVCAGFLSLFLTWLRLMAAQKHQLTPEIGQFLHTIASKLTKWSQHELIPFSVTPLLRRIAQIQGEL